ncbi:MAG: metallophosphoesterase family protein [Lachnospiraceae bacterium]|jgi:calcineurin-like phosphoesterase family protein|nr:metallophosphoesterase family protein [Lachnospiraceae bacterium]
MRKRQTKVFMAILAMVLLMSVFITACKTGTDKDVQEPKQNAQQVQPAEEEQQEAMRPGAVSEIQQAENEKTPKEQAALFLPDYTSAPLLNTTEIKCLSMQAGITEDRVQLNWLSPSGEPGKTEWKDSSGNIRSFASECTSSVTVPGYYVNKAVVSGLRRGESYTYRVGNEDAWSPEYTYQIPEDTGTFTFLVTSDAQIGQSEMEYPEETAKRWDSVLTRLKSYVPEAELLLHTGDQVADFGNQEEYELFLEHLALYGIPLVPVVGNHDVANETSIEENGHPDGPYFYEHFFVPNRSNMAEGQYDQNGNYAFVRGNVLFIVLNGCYGHPGEFHEAYVEQIVSLFPDVKWRIVAQHYSPYSGVGSSGNKISDEYLAHITMDNNIDLVLTGHDHAYARSAFVNREKAVLDDYDYKSGGVAVNPKGALYVVCGTSSGCLYHPIETEEHLVFQGQPEAPVAIRIDVTDKELHLQTYLVDTWTLYDEYTIRKE